MAERDDTPTAYLEFLAKYPDSEFAEMARERIEALKESGAWERAQFRDTQPGYTGFIEKFPDSAFVADAQQKLLELQRDDAWAIAQAADSAELLTAFLRDYPNAPQTEQARELMAELETTRAREKPVAPTERPGDFRIQLASFRTALSADTELRRLVVLFPDALLGPITIQSPREGDSNPMFVLKSVPMNRDEAQTVCQKLTELKQVCLIVKR
jgi:hypothetical protein